MLFLTICKQLSIKMLNWLSVSRDVRRRECPLMNGVWRFPLQDAGPSTTLLVRTMRSWAVSSFKPRILLAPWHSNNPMQGYEALWAEWHCQSEYCGARHDVQSRAGWPVRGYQSSPRPSNPSASIARPAGEPCYALLCPASAESLSEKSREHVRERDRVSWLNPVSHTSSSEDVHRAQTR